MRISLIAVVTGAVIGIGAPLVTTAPAVATPRTVTQVTAAATTAASGTSALALPAALTRNKIYRSGMPSTLDCSNSAPQNGSAASIRRFLGQVRTCLNRMWTRQFAKVGLKFTAPKVVLTTRLTRSPCRRLTVTTPAHYCPTLQTIYFKLWPLDVKQPFALSLARTLAHEYGHHVQRRTGILSSFYNTYVQTHGTTARRVFNHRMELQADCFAGVFLSVTAGTLPVDQRDFDFILDWTSKHVNDHEHGTGRNIAYWLNHGYTSGSVNGCNTFAAATSRVV